MRRSKRVAIVTLIERVNNWNQNSCDMPEAAAPAERRRGWNAFLEAVLHQAHLFAGFRLLSASDDSLKHFHTHPYLSSSHSDNCTCP